MATFLHLSERVINLAHVVQVEPVADDADRFWVTLTDGRETARGPDAALLRQDLAAFAWKPKEPSKGEASGRD